MEHDKLTATVSLLMSRGLIAYIMFAFLLLLIGNGWQVVIGAVLIYTVYDLIGYENTDKGNLFRLQAFRITSYIFFCLLVWFLCLKNIQSGIAFAVLLIFGVCDLLYYLIGLYPIKGVRWTWLRWTPWGWFKKELSTVQVILQAFAGIISVFLSYIL